jgi:dimethylargininase
MGLVRRKAPVAVHPDRSSVAGIRARDLPWSAMRHTQAIVRPPPATFAAGLSSAPAGAPDLARALVQHRDYCEALTACGLTLTVLPADPAYPDSCFVEDPAIVTATGAMVTRPGAPSRAGEADSIAAALRSWFRDLVRMTPPGTLDGGDVCQVDGHFLVGLSGRTNEEGARQLTAFLETLGYRSSIVNIRGTEGLLHLKSGMSYLGDGRIVVVPELSRLEALRPYELIVVPDKERYAANCLPVNGRVLIAAGHPDLDGTLSGLGYETLPIDVSEFRKMDGSLTCLSLRV